MTIASTTQNPEALTLTIVTQFAAPPTRVWQIWSDPRQLERWWGPPTWPATFEVHDLVVGGVSRYRMTETQGDGSAGEQSCGLWRILTVQKPELLEFEDAFADDAGQPNLEMPTMHARVTLTAVPDGTQMTITSTFVDLAQMEQLAEMGMVEGMTAALSQVDQILTAG